MLLYRILLVLAVLVAAFCVFVVGAILYQGGDATSGLLVWLAILAVVCAIIWGGTRLAARGNYLLANILLALVVLAAACLILFFYALFRALGGG